MLSLLSDLRFGAARTLFALTFVLCLLAPLPVRGADPDPTPQQLQDQVKTLELRQKVVLESMEKTYSYGLWFISVAVAITTLLSAIRYVQDQRLLKDAQELGKSYKNNIDTTNALMTSIKNALDYYKSAQDIENRVKELKDLQTLTARHSEDQMTALNTTAMELCPKCKRNSHNDPNVQRLVRDFHDQYEILKLSAQATEQLNANGHFILAFHHRIENNYGDALKEFELAQTIATRDEVTSSAGSYRNLPAGVNLSMWLKKLINICAYHRAILSNNLGQYGEAKRLFEIALANDPLDYQSLAYIPETEFLGGLASFSQVVADFEAAIAKVDSLTPEVEKQGSYTLNQATLLALLYMKLANCYMADTPNVDYRSHRDLAEAERLVRKARTYDSGSLFARLSLAQLLHRSGRDDAEKRKLFAEVFGAAKDVVTRITEAKILMMYYYTMLISCSYSEISGELPGLYVIRILELVTRLPKPPLPLTVWIFSPLTKWDWEVAAFTAEVQAFGGGMVTAASSASTVNGPGEKFEPAGKRRTVSAGRSLLDGE